MARELTCPASPLITRSGAVQWPMRPRWVRIFSLCWLLLGLTACGRVEPPTANSEQVAKNDGSQPLPESKDQVGGHLKERSDKTGRPSLEKLPEPGASIPPSPSEKLADLIKNNEVLPTKAMVGKPFTFQLPKVDGAHVELSPPGGPTGLTLTPDGLLAWTPDRQRAMTYDVVVNILPGNVRRMIRIVLEENPENALPLSKIGGWVLLSDGVTLIVALPDQSKLVYIDTVTNKELKRVQLSFKPNLVAVQGKRLFVSALSPRSELHVLDRDSGEDKKTITLPGAWLLDMVCDREKGLVYAVRGDGAILMTINPDAADGAPGITQPVVIDASAVANTQGDPATGRPFIEMPRSLSLAMDPNNANVLYAILRSEDPKLTSYLVKFTIKGKDFKAVWASPVRPIAERTRNVVRVSNDGKRVGAIDGASSAGNIVGISLFDGKARTGVAGCGDYLCDLALHPVLELGVAEQNNVRASLPNGAPESQTVLHLFNSKSLVETTFTLAGTDAIWAGGRLLTFGARGTKIVYYDWAQGYLRSMPLTLTEKDKEALAKHYPGK